MNDNVTIPAALADINRVEYNGQPVLTTAQLADAYDTTIDVLWQNFKRNRDRYVEGTHFYKLVGDELKAFKDELKNCQVVGERASHLYLWTKRGALRHCKSVNTEMAWAVFELLEDTYFDSKRDDNKPVSDFHRGVELGKLAPHAKHPVDKQRIVAHAANLILGKDFIRVQDYPAHHDAEQLTLFIN